VGDGAPWIWNLAAEHFPGAVQIVDLYHAKEHVWDVAHAVFGPGTAAGTAWATHACSLLEQGHSEALISAISALPPIPPEPGQARSCPERAIDYFTTNAQRMRYPVFRAEAHARGQWHRRGRLQNHCQHPRQTLWHALDACRHRCALASAYLRSQRRLRLALEARICCLIAYNEFIHPFFTYWLVSPHGCGILLLRRKKVETILLLYLLRLLKASVLSSAQAMSRKEHPWSKIMPAFYHSAPMAPPFSHCFSDSYPSYFLHRTRGRSDRRLSASARA